MAQFISTCICLQISCSISRANSFREHEVGGKMRDKKVENDGFLPTKPAVKRVPDKIWFFFDRESYFFVLFYHRLKFERFLLRSIFSGGWPTYTVQIYEKRIIVVLA